LKVRRCRAGQYCNGRRGGGGCLAKWRQETQTEVIGQDRRVGTERRGQTGKVRKYRAAKKNLGRTAWTRILK